jgi:hypothetical protein
MLMKQVRGLQFIALKVSEREIICQLMLFMQNLT